MIPNPPKEKTESKETNQQEQAKDTPKQEEEKKKQQSPIMPSSKAPAPGEY